MASLFFFPYFHGGNDPEDRCAIIPINSWMLRYPKMAVRAHGEMLEAFVNSVWRPTLMSPVLLGWALIVRVKPIVDAGTHGVAFEAGYCRSCRGLIPYQFRIW